MSSTVDEIAIKLGIQTGDLKSALSDANARIVEFGQRGSHGVDGLTSSIHETHQAMRLFHQFLVGGGIVEAIKKFYESAISYAEKHTEDTDAQTEAVRRFGSALSETTGLVAKVSVQVLGVFAQAGENAVGWWQKLTGTYGDALNAQKISAEAEQNISDIAKAELETHKELAEIYTKQAEAYRKLAESENEGLTNTQKMVKLTDEIEANFERLSHYSEGSVEYERIKLQILLGQAQLRKDIAAVEKEQDAEQEKADAQEIRDVKIYADLQQKRIDDEHKATELLLKGKENLNAVEKIDLDLLLGKTTQVKLNAEFETLYAKLLDGTILPDERERLSILQGHVPEIKKIITEVQVLNKEWSNFKASFNSVGGSVQTLSDVQLKALIVKLQNQQSQQRDIYNPQNDAYNPLLQETNLMLQNALRELDLRRNFQQTVAAFGGTAAEVMFDPATFDRLSQLFNPNQQAAQANDISLIAGTLKNLFPGQAQPTR